MCLSMSAHGPDSQEGAPDPMLGKVLHGRFSILEVIGKGGMGRVYKAVQAPLDRLVALKVLNPHYGGGRDPQFHKRFFLEASLTAKLRHPNTITVIDYGRTDEGIFYIAMEYVEGQTLAQVLAATGPIAWQRTLDMAQQICRSLREAHKLGIIHRDLKPANVMLLSSEADHDTVKVLDFGLVRPLEQRPDAEITQGGVMLGSPLYMAPEQARHVADVRSDIYSLGVVMYQMLMGRPPFQTKDPMEAILQHLSQKPPPFSQVRPDLPVPAEVEAIVMRALQKEPAQRYQTMDEFLEAIRGVGQSLLGGSGTYTDPRMPAVSGPRWSMPTPPPLPQPGSPTLVTPPPTTPWPATPPGTPPPLAQPPFARAQEDGASVSVVLDADEPRARQTAQKPSATNAKVLFAGTFITAVALGGGAMWWLGRPAVQPAAVAVTVPSAPPSAQPVPEPVAPEPAAPVAPVVAEPVVPEPALQVEPAAAANVQFVVTSDPVGARVFFGESDLGPAPVRFEVPAGSNGEATATVKLTLDGYQPRTLTAKGSGPRVELNGKLKKKAAREPKEDPYKDDPYQ